MQVDPAHNPVIKIVTQRGEGDCGIAAIAMLLGRTYEDVLAAAVSKTKSRTLHVRGVHFRQIRQTLDALGYRTRTKRKVDFDNDCGIVDITHRDGRHVAVLKAGLLFDTTGVVWEPEFYLLDQEGHVTALYYVEPKN
jgi:hypothetical protein